MKSRHWWSRVDLFSIFLLALGSSFVLQSWQLERSTSRMPGEMVGPAGFPLVLSILWVGLLLILVIYESVKARTLSSYKTNIYDIRVARWLFLVFLTLFYVFAVKTAGFITTTVIYLAILMIFFGATKKYQVALAVVLSLAVTVAVYFIYSALFRLPLPGVF